MRDMLESCIAMDTFAQNTYAAMSDECKDAELALVFSLMSTEEESHVGWWRDLIKAWDQGLVPDIVNETDVVEQHMRSLLEDLERALPAGGLKDLTTDEMLDLAGRIEFIMLDPIFGEFMDLMEPGGAMNHKQAYSLHLDRIVGAIEMFYSRGETARFLAQVLRRAWRDNLALAAFSNRDPLTTLYNRRGMLTHLSQWVSWAQRYDRPLAIALVDVDNFRHVNESHGHAMGDMALRVIADALRKTVRGSDLVARYGGDEFAIVAPETDSEELTRLLERIVETVRETNLTDWDGSPITLTVSVGAAIASGHQLIDPGVDRILAAADGSLCAAKAEGKNRYSDPVIMSEEPVND